MNILVLLYEVSLRTNILVPAETNKLIFTKNDFFVKTARQINNGFFYNGYSS